jgi:predicted deacylase
VTIIKQHLAELSPGEVGRGQIPVGGRASGGSEQLPYLLAKGDGRGPSLWVNAAVHGDESQAVMVAIEFFRTIRGEHHPGDVVVTPVANPVAFDHRTKHSPYDGIDLDQSFPGRPDFLGTQRVAHLLFSEIDAVADAVVNVHTMGPFLEACQYAVYKQDPGGGRSELDQLAQIALLGPRVACRMRLDGTGELPGNIAGALDYQVLATGRPAFMLEAGASGGVDPGAVGHAARGLVRLGTSLGTLAGESPTPASSICRVTQRTHVTSDHAGFFLPTARPGEVVPAGAVFGEVRNVFGDVVETMRTDEPVLVIGIRSDPVVHVGDRVAFVATEWDDVALADAGAPDLVGVTA